jgi:hypothetical protein
MNITLVTCYYNIKSKQPHSQYLEWMGNLLKNIKCPLIVYCDSSSKKSIEDIIKLNKNKFIKIVTLEMSDFFVNQYQKYFEYSYSIDAEKNIHSIDLYKVWNEKFNFTKKAIEINPFNSDYFYWIDIGCFRKNCTGLNYNNFKNWPNTKKLEQYSNNIILFQTHNFSEKDKILDNYGLTNDNLCIACKHKGWGGGRLVAGFFGGKKENMLLFSKLYYDMLIKWNFSKRFIGKENYIMTNVYLQNIDMFHLFTKDNTNMQHTKDTHMWFQEYLL